jgi:oxygen-independent coproporphyrinogen-3 oxidase
MNKEILGVYIHIPFCLRKCNYCDFVSYPGKLGQEKQYIEALSCEMKQYHGKRIDTLYLGGGTPSLLGEKSLERLFYAIRREFQITADAEITMEVNPATVTREKLALCRKLGINRLSIGVQSLDRDELTRLGRLHSPEEAVDVIKLAKSEGFSNLSADIIYGVAGQSLESLSNTAGILCDLDALTHISCYALRCEEGTPFGAMQKAGRQVEAEEDSCADQYQLLCNQLAEAGMNRYEISNFSKQGFRSRHNMKYWKCEPYIGLGVAAHSCLDHKRFFHTGSLEAYLSNPEAIELEEVLGIQEEKTEFVIMGLRLQEGFSEQEYERRFQSRFSDDFAIPVKRFLENGMLCFEHGHYRLAERAMFVSNAILCEFT